MLYDFMLLEAFYGPSSAALYLEDLSLRYGLPAIQKALSAGELTARRIFCGPDCGRLMLWMTEKGRREAGLKYRVKNV